MRGIISNEKEILASKNMNIVNYLLANDLNDAILESDLIIARSGYTTIMDLAILGKKSFFIPTPGQTEQEYLAEFMSHKKLAPFNNQNNFRLKNLKEIENYKGFNSQEYANQFDLKFLNLFQGK